jgi:hypothetical protein
MPEKPLFFLVGGEASREVVPPSTAAARELPRPDREEDEKEEALLPGLDVRFRTTPEEVGKEERP